MRLQEAAHVGPGSNADALAAWKAGDTTDTGYPHPSTLPGACITGRPILGTAHMLKGCIVEFVYESISDLQLQEVQL